MSGSSNPQNPQGETPAFVEAERLAAGPSAGRSCLGSTLYALIGLASALYLLNLGWGVADVLPDNLPFVGNLDEVFFTGLLLGSLHYFGIDPTRFLKWGRPKEPRPPGR